MSIASQFPVVAQPQATSALRTLALVPGQQLEAKVLGPGLDGATMVQVGRHTLSLNLPDRLAGVTSLTLAVQNADGQLRLALVPPAQGVAQGAPATSVEISRQPPMAAPLTYGPAAAPVAGAPVAGAATAPGTAVPGTVGTPQQAIAPVGPAPSATAGQTMQKAVPNPYGMPVSGIGNSTVTQGGGPAVSPSQVALAQMVQRALPAQASLGAITGVLSATISQLAVPEPVLKAARQILDNQLVARDGKIEGAALKGAIGRSGIFQEAMIAKGMAGEAALDTKSGLLALRQSLGQWLGNQAAIAQISQLPPPMRHVHPRARQPELLLPLLPTDPEDMGRLLLERTEGALSRLRLHQNASLHDGSRTADSQWSLDLPVVYAGQQAIVHLQIHRDPQSEEARPEDRGWQVRFAVNLASLGEVGAQISLRGLQTGIMLWADREDTAAQFSAGISELKQALEEAGLNLGALVVRNGGPSEMQAPASSGQFLDEIR
ncbi:hook-length control protein FliK [Devosia crocina]|uniref:Hook-length control protein FliK n=1 Tax=Devosia crocina TaxID=429728 RepID=A0A1I7NA20_9HYPH|nr:flagellar hook-length control protein FliK [Devosia crocina]SFV31522.1 hook-length control protein FliK [Devosia crocina]